MACTKSFDQQSECLWHLSMWWLCKHLERMKWKYTVDGFWQVWWQYNYVFYDLKVNSNGELLKSRYLAKSLSFTMNCYFLHNCGVFPGLPVLYLTVHLVCWMWAWTLQLWVTKFKFSNSSYIRLEVNCVLFRCFQSTYGKLLEWLNVCRQRSKK